MRRLAIAVAGALGLQTHLNGMSAAFRRRTAPSQPHSVGWAAWAASRR